MTSKSIQIQIAQQDFRMLKANGYRLCFAKRVNDSYNVVWQSTSQYLASNRFSWVPLYQLFGSNTFRPNVNVQVSTNLVGITPGEQAVLTNSGMLSEPTTGGASGAITLIDQYGSIHPGLNCLSTNINGEQISTPIYVAPNAVVAGAATLTPADRVLVWFEQNIQTSTMLGRPPAHAVEIDLTNTDSATRLYQNGQWTTPMLRGEHEKGEDEIGDDTEAPCSP